MIRHAKSSWDDPSQRDIDRPLNARGKKQSRQLGTFMEEQQIAPDRILCSPAKRARQTLKQIGKNWQCDAETVIENRLYLASVNTIRSLLEEYGKAHPHLLIIGHNPGLHMLAQKLAIRGTETDLDLLREKYPTATLCTIRVKTDCWKKIGKAGSKLIYLATPRQPASR